jgi:hypothetical protein
MFFACTKARQERASAGRERHVVELTGRSKAAGRRGGIRNSDRSREYTCACGHTGWSRHVDLEYRAKARDKKHDDNP